MNPHEKDTLDALLGRIDRHTLGEGHARQRPILQERKELRPKGRPTSKDPGTVYVKVNAAIPEALRDRMKLALLTTFKGRFRTQDEIMEAALTRFLESTEG